MTAPRPKCAYCNKPYGRRDVEGVRVEWTPGQPMPPYQGNGIVVKTHEVVNQPQTQIVTSSRSYPGHEKLIEIGHPVAHGYYDVWDGETWVKPYEPFCTLRCALKFARWAHHGLLAGAILTGGRRWKPKS